MGEFRASVLTAGIFISAGLNVYYSFSRLRWLPLAFIILAALNNRYGYGLIRFPGPFWATTTHWWRLKEWYANGNKRPSMLQLHAKYGNIVRLGPSSLSFASPYAIDAIYGPKANMAKTGFYTSFEAHGKGERKANIFSTRDIHWHARYRDLVKHSFSIDHVGHKEGEIDDLIKIMLQKLDNQLGDAIDLPMAIQYFTFDAGGVFSFSHSFGFLQKWGDIDGQIASTRSGTTHLSRLSQVPFFQWLVDQNPMAKYFGFITPPMAFSRKHMPWKLVEQELDAPLRKPERYDILDGYVKAYKTDPGVVGREEVVDLALMTVVPNSEAIRTAIFVLFFNLARRQDMLAKVEAELDDAFPDKNAIPAWNIASKLPILDACIKETFRIHPSTGFLLERIVPAGGAVICGEFVPAGTAVSCLQWIIHRHKPTFGDDVEVFRPERWLDASPEQRANMEKFLVPFGYGSRLCLGRDIGLFEVYKITATVLNRYRVHLETPEQEMKYTWGNIVNVDYTARLERR